MTGEENRFSYTGFFWERWAAIHRCQLLVLPATGFDLCHHFSCLILLIKESLFSIMLNQDLFIVQETIKTLMGHDWPHLPCGLIFSLLVLNTYAVLNFFRIPQSQMLSPCWALAWVIPFSLALLTLASSCVLRLASLLPRGLSPGLLSWGLPLSQSLNCN